MVVEVGVRAVAVDLLLNQGATLRARFLYQVGGVAQPLSGYTAVLRVARKRSGTAIFSLTEDDNEIVLEPESITGAIDVFFPVAKTNLLTRSEGPVYDLTISTGTDPTDDVIRLFEGGIITDLAAVKVA